MKFGDQKFWFSTNVEKGDPNLGGERTAEVKLTRIGNGVAPRTLGRRKEQGPLGYICQTKEFKFYFKCDLQPLDILDILDLFWR